jgi:Holliday junction resolvase RusA-like endonuclease
VITFTVHGEPVAKGRPRVSTMRGVPRMYTPTKTVAYEALVGLAAHQAMGAADLEMLAGPVELSFTAVFAIPKGWTKARQAAHALRPEYVTKRPDLDNIAKALADGMNCIVFSDDSQIAQTGVCRKVYGPVPGVTVTVRPLHAHEGCA